MTRSSASPVPDGGAPRGAAGEAQRGWRTKARCRAAAIAAILLVAGGLARGWLHPEAMAGAWLAAWTFWLAPGVGACSLLLMVRLAGGAWETALQPVLRAFARTLPAMLAAGLPLLLLAPGLYPAMRDGHAVMAGVPVPVQLMACAAFWLWLGWRLRRPPPLSRAGAGLAALGQLMAVTLVAVDTLMALQPAFHSASFGLMQGVAQMLAAMAMALLVVPALPTRAARTAGGVLLMLSLLWGYLAFMAYLTVWGADLPDEIAWYLPRTRTNWSVLMWPAAVLQGLLPLAAFLVPALRRGHRLRFVAAAVVVGAALDAFVTVGPALHPAGVAHGVDALLAGCGLGAVWGWVLRRGMRFEAVGVADAPAVALDPPVPVDALRLSTLRRAVEVNRRVDRRSEAERVHLARRPVLEANHRRDDRSEAERIHLARRPAGEMAHSAGWHAEPDIAIPGRTAARAGLVFAGVLAAVLAGSYLYWASLFRDDRAFDSNDLPPRPPPPTLQVDARADRAAAQAAQRDRLETYGWADREHGIARIPIERAMAIQAQRGDTQ